MSTDSEARGSQPVRLSKGWVVILLVLLVGAIAYLWIGFEYAASASYLTPGGNWLEQLLNLGIRVLGWPLMAATHH